MLHCLLPFVILELVVLRRFRCDTLMEECDVWVIFPFFEEQVVDSNIVTSSNFQMVYLVEMLREKT
jgi:hypothetical protein